MPQSLTRRAFAEQVALAAAAPFVLGDDVLGLGTRASGLEMTRPRPEPQTPSPEPAALAKALAEGVRLRYGDPLSAGDLQTIKPGIRNRLPGLERPSPGTPA